MRKRPRRPASVVRRRRQRTGNIALVLLGAAALGGGGAWAIDRLTQPSCDPNVDPQCQRSSSSRGGYWGSSSSGGSRSSSTPASPGSTERGGFGSVGRLFSGGS
jgi:hypothetical protein